MILWILLALVYLEVVQVEVHHGLARANLPSVKAAPVLVEGR